VLALRRRILGPEHPDTLTAMNNLAASYHDAGRREEALGIREEVLVLHRKLSGSEHSDTLSAMHNLLRDYKAAGLKDKLGALREEVLALSQKMHGTNHAVTRNAKFNLAASYFDAERTGDALGLLSEVLEGNPEDTMAVLRVVAIQLWFGQDVACGETLRRVLEQAAESQNADHLGRMAKVLCLRPQEDPSVATPVIDWARIGLERGEEQAVKPWRHLTLGMALFRGGLYADALVELQQAENLAQTVAEASRNRIIPTAAFYRAMSLFQQEEVGEARSAFVAAEAHIKPPPTGAEEAVSAHHDDLILWLTYKEAREMLSGLAPSLDPSGADEER
jgi:tetratricopeptide (TPR) repeat protein